MNSLHLAPAPRVSVIVPNYNHARFLRQRIDSILAQTFTDFELLLLDDCSTDDSRTVLQSYADEPRVRLLLNEQNSGSTFRQWQKGIEQTSAPYVWIAESDDFAAPSFLQRMVELLDAGPAVGIAYCESNVVDANGAVQSTTHADFKGIGDNGRWTTDFISTGTRECAEYLSQQNTIANASAVVFRRAVYLAAGGPDLSMRLCGDWKLWSQMLLRSDLAHVAEPLNFFRYHGQNVRASTRHLQMMSETMDVVNLIRSSVPVGHAQLDRIRTWTADAWINTRLFRSGDPEQRAEMARKLKAFDPHLRRRLASRWVMRSLSVIWRGRFRHWVSLLVGRLRRR